MWTAIAIDEHALGLTEKDDVKRIVSRPKEEFARTIIGNGIDGTKGLPRMRDGV